MKRPRSVVIAVTLMLLFRLSIAACAQSTTGGANSNSVPSLINYSGVLKDDAGKTLTSATAVTFLIYDDEQNGSPAWMETQNVTPNSSGHYTVQLGSASSKGLPADLFQTGEARWLAVQIAGEVEQQPRILLVAVPYAMKAADAQTLGGLPASAFLLAASANAGGNNGATAESDSSSSSAKGNAPNTSSDVTTTGGTVNAIPLFTTSTNIQNSILTQTGTTGLSVAGSLSFPALGTATASKGFDSQPQLFIGSSFDNTVGTAENQTFQWQVEPANNNSANASGTLNLLYGLDSVAPSETGLHIASNGLITFASGQTFPGTGEGTITGVTAGTGLSGGGTSGTVTLNINTSVIPELGSANTFTKNLSSSGELAAGGPAGGHTANGTVEVDAGNTNNGTYSPGLNFGGGGESIASNRAGTTNLDGIDFYTKDARRMSITNGGNVGIATASPTHLLEVDGSTSTTTAQMAMVSPGTDAAISVKNTASGGREYWIDSGSGKAGIGAGNFAVYDVTAGLTRFVIGPTGNVGIGTTSPGAPLHVVANSADAIYASDSSTTTAAIYGGATAATGAAWGVEGVTASGNLKGYGVYGLATDTDPYAIGMGVYGQSYGQSGVGVFGQNGAKQSDTGLEWIGYPVGVWADAGSGTPTDGFAFLATADGASAGLFVNDSSDHTTFNIEADNTAGNVFTASNAANSKNCNIDQNANLTCSGTIGAVVPVDGGSRQLGISAIQSPNTWFEDADEAHLSNGVAVVTLDGDFAQTVSTSQKYQVFLTPYGDCKGLYVTNRTASSFEVHELGGGTANLSFGYRIMALRKNYENVRFADHTSEVQRLRQESERMHARTGSGQSHDSQRNPLLKLSSQQAELRPAAAR